VLRQVKSLPGVIDAAATSSLPGYGGPSATITVPGRIGSAPWLAKVDLCNDRLFATLALKRVHGSVLSEGDIESARHVAVVNQTLARAFFGVDDPHRRRANRDPANIFGRAEEREAG